MNPGFVLTVLQDTTSYFIIIIIICFLFGGMSHPTPSPMSQGKDGPRAKRSDVSGKNRFTGGKVLP